MSEKNVERFLEANDAFNRGDLEAVLARYDANSRKSDCTTLDRKAARVYETEGHRFESCRARSVR